MRIADRGSAWTKAGKRAARGKRVALREREGDSVARSNVLSNPVQSNQPRLILYAAAILSLLAALIHLWVMPEHFGEWWGYGTFFLVAAMAQGLYGLALLRWPRQLLLRLGIGGNLAIIVLYGITRTVGIPFFGPDAGEAEGVGMLDLSATMLELALVISLLMAQLRGLSREKVVRILLVLGLAVLFLGHLLHLMLSGSPGH